MFPNIPVVETLVDVDTLVLPEDEYKLKCTTEDLVQPEENSDLCTSVQWCLWHEKGHGWRLWSIEEGFAHGFEDLRDPSLGRIQLPRVVIALPHVINWGAIVLAGVVPEVNVVLQPNQTITVHMLSVAQHRGLNSRVSEHAHDVWVTRDFAVQGAEMP